jgi:hypothetical protein
MAMTRNRVSGRTAAAGRTLPGATIVGPLLAALVLVGAAVSLAGCGDAAIAGGKPATGALVGGGVGALGGVLTSP